MENQNDTPRSGPFGRLLSLAGRCARPFERVARRLLGPNGDLKVLAVVLAAILYSIVRPAAAGIERTVSVPVRVLPQGGFTVVGFSPSAVSVTLRGTTKDFTAFDAESLRVDLRPKPAEGVLSEVVAIGPKDVTNDLAKLDKIRVVGVAPEAIAVEYDYMSVSETKDFIARPQLTGLDKLRGTASVSEESLEHLANRSVRIYGSEKKLRALKDKGIRLPTDPIDVVGKTESFDVDVAIRPPEDSGITRVEPDHVRVHVIVEIEKDPDSESIHVSDPIRLSTDDAEAPRPPAKSAETPEAPSEGRPAAAPGEAQEENPPVEADSAEEPRAEEDPAAPAANP